MKDGEASFPTATQEYLGPLIFRTSLN